MQVTRATELKLDADIDKVVLRMEGVASFNVEMREDSFGIDTECTVWSPDSVFDAVRAVLTEYGVSNKQIECITCGGVEITQGSFEDNGLSDGVRLSIILRSCSTAGCLVLNNKADSELIRAVKCGYRLSGVVVPDSPSLCPREGVTISTWMKPTIVQQHCCFDLVAKVSSNWDDGYNINSNTAGTLSNFAQGWGGSYSQNSRRVLQADRWQQIVSVSAGSHNRLFHKFEREPATLINEWTSSNAFNAAPGEPLQLGHHMWNNSLPYAFQGNTP